MPPKTAKGPWLKTQDKILRPLLVRIAHEIQNMPQSQTQAPRALLVGGFVRDAIRGEKPKDADLEIFGVDPEQLEQKLTFLFPKKVDMVGKSFGTLKVHVAKGYELDISLPRRESKSGKGHKGFFVESDPNMGLEEAARRRDFTINAMAADPLTGEFFDPFHGAQDLKDNILRVVDPTTFQEDPLRLYRAAQFIARFQLTPDPKSVELMKKMVKRGDTKELSKERITEELKKLFLKSSKPSLGFEFLRTIGVIERDYPELDILTKTPQEPEWHPEGDVWIHTMMVLDSAAALLKLKGKKFTDEQKLQTLIGALCHDLGKATTTAPGEKHGIPRIRSLGHEAAGKEPAKALCDHWIFGGEITHAAEKIAEYHLRPFLQYQEKEKTHWNADKYASSVRRLMKKIKPLDWRVLLLVAEADHFGRGIKNIKKQPFKPGKAFAKIVKDFKLEETFTPLVQGQDLLDLGLAPGPRVGQLLQKIEEERDRGEIKSRDEALRLLKEWIKN